jgi:integrase/recombinase XerD
MYDEIYNYRKELQNLGYSKSIVNNYPKYVKVFLEFTHELLENINETHIKNYSNYLQNRPNKRRIGKLSESYIHSQQLAIKGFFDYLERIAQITQNPFTLKLKSPTYQQRIVFTQEEIQTLYKTAQTLEEIIILHLCYGCGLRRSEVLNLNTKDIDLEKKLLYVRKGKNKKRRVMPLTESIINDFKKHQDFSNKYQDEVAFLTNKLGKRMCGSTIYKIFKNHLKRTKNLEENKYCLHSLRHSIATHLLENEMPVEMVRDFLGHSQLSTTQIYARINQLKMR